MATSNNKQSVTTYTKKQIVNANRYIRYVDFLNGNLQDNELYTLEHALIILVTPWYHTGKVAATGLSNVDYANAMRSLAEYRNDERIVCLYAADPNTIGVNMNDASFRAKYCIAENDVSHLNLDGMKYVLTYMEQFIAAEYTILNAVNLLFSWIQMTYIQVQIHFRKLLTLSTSRTVQW